MYQWRNRLGPRAPLRCCQPKKTFSSFLLWVWNVKVIVLRRLSVSAVIDNYYQSKSAAVPWGNQSKTHQDQHQSNPNTPGVAKMSQFLSKTVTIAAIALLIHFIVVSSFALKQGSWKEVSKPMAMSLPASSGKTLTRHRNSGAGSSISPRRSARSFRGETKNLNVDKEELEVGGGGGALSNTVLLTPSIMSMSPSDPAGTGSRPVQAVGMTDALFATENSTVVTAQIGSIASLPCVVRNSGNGVASWMRRRDYSLLTVGMGTITHDDRFYVSHSRTTQNWELHIKFVKPKDEGLYECQISTHPPASIFINLRVVEARAEILGEPDKHVRSGSTFELVCVLRESTEPPVYVFWYHNERMINYDNVRGVVVNSDAEKSILVIEDAQKTDSGNYSCVPSNARPTSISVHILNGEKPAAMQHGSRSSSTGASGDSLWCLLIGLCICIVSAATRSYALHHQIPSSQSQSHLECESELISPAPRGKFISQLILYSVELAVDTYQHEGQTERLMSKAPAALLDNNGYGNGNSKDFSSLSLKCVKR